jgi:hypothetical protein
MRVIRSQKPPLSGDWAPGSARDGGVYWRHISTRDGRTRPAPNFVEGRESGIRKEARP